MEIHTIGFTQKTARKFFTILKEAGIRTLIDVRLNNTSQLAAYTKKDDLEFFLAEILGARYLHMPEAAPTKELMDAYKKKEIAWEEYRSRFHDLMRSRSLEGKFDKEFFREKAVLLCSEHNATHCHRRLVAEYLRDKWEEPVEIVHL